MLELDPCFDIMDGCHLGSGSQQQLLWFGGIGGGKKGNPKTTLWGRTVIALYYKWGHWGTEWTSNLPRSYEQWSQRYVLFWQNTGDILGIWNVILQVALTTIFSSRVRKILNLRVFEDESGKHWSKSVMDKQYEVLCVSQFTLQCVLKGNKPDFHLAMPTEQAESFYNSFLEQLRKTYRPELIKGRQGSLWDTYGETRTCNPSQFSSKFVVYAHYLKQRNSCCSCSCCIQLLSVPIPFPLHSFFTFENV